MGRPGARAGKYTSSYTQRSIRQRFVPQSYFFNFRANIASNIYPPCPAFSILLSIRTDLYAPRAQVRSQLARI